MLSLLQTDERPLTSALTQSVLTKSAIIKSALTTGALAKDELTTGANRACYDRGRYDQACYEQACDDREQGIVNAANRVNHRRAALYRSPGDLEQSIRATD